MVRLIIMAIIIEVIIVLFTMYIFDNLGKRINNKLKMFFIQKLQDFNYLIEEKEKELEELKHEIQIEKLKLKELKPDEEVTFSDPIEKQLRKMKLFNEGKIKLVDEEDIVYNYSSPEFREEEFFSNYKRIRKYFKVDTEEIVKEFISKNKNTKEQDEKYHALIELKLKFGKKATYELLTLSSKEQYSILDEVLTDNEKKIVDYENKYKGNSEFTVLVLLDEINELIKLNDPNVYIYVSRPTPVYNRLSKNIKTFVYKNISEGVIINYKGKMYDYSI